MRVERPEIPEIPGVGRLVVYTCITGDYDIPLESPWALRCPHLCFTDAPRLRSATWTRVPLEGDDALDPVRRSRLPKLLPHRYLDAACDVSIWIDASAVLLVDPVTLARRALDGADFAIPKHPARDCAFEEIETCVNLGKDAEAALQAQAQAYRDGGLPPHSGLWEATLIVRRHRQPQVIALMESWWREYLQGSRRDQLSLAWVAWRTGAPIRSLPVRSLPRKPAPDPIYRLQRHHVRRTPTERLRVAVREWFRRCRTRLLRALAAR